VNKCRDELLGKFEEQEKANTEFIDDIKAKMNESKAGIKN